MHLTSKQLFKLVSSLLIVVTLGAGITVLYNLNKTAIDKELVALDLLPKPETFTELYFNDSAKLPSSVTSKQQAISFAFVIHNLEATDYQYVYEVSVNANNANHVVDSGNVLVKNNQYYVKNEKFSLLNAPGKQEIVVALINKQLSIDFWVEG